MAKMGAGGTPAWCTTWSKPQVLRTCAESQFQQCRSTSLGPWGLSSGHFAQSPGHSQSPCLGSHRFDSSEASSGFRNPKATTDQRQIARRVQLVPSLAPKDMLLRAPSTTSGWLLGRNAMVCDQMAPMKQCGHYSNLLVAPWGQHRQVAGRLALNLSKRPWHGDSAGGKVPSAHHHSNKWDGVSCCFIYTV